MRRLSLLFAGLSLLATQAQAYVTSAVLEYSVDDRAAFYLNGSPILRRSKISPFNYEVLSTSDGTLPMELFKAVGENTLAVEDYDLECFNMSVSYRFTVHTSEGDPIVIWGIPEQAKMLHLSKDQPDPQGWTQPGFDDSSWKPAVAVTSREGTVDAFPGLLDPAFVGSYGTRAFVSRLSHIFNMNCACQDHNLFRSHFRFPDHPAKVSVLINPPAAENGQRVAVRLVPGPDTAELSQFNLLAWLPEGLQFLQASAGGKWNEKLRRLDWNFGSKDLDVRYAKMGAQSVISASGWQSPEKLLGREKAGKADRKLNIPDSIWEDGAVVTAGMPGWFKMEAPAVDLSAWKPTILGVIFHTQIKLGGKDFGSTLESDSVQFNYSIDGSTQGVLRRDVDLSRMTDNQYWFDGYYDASEDRKWTWDELQRLAVRFNVIARGTVDQNLIASVVATVKYYSPAKASPYFFAKVIEPGCATLTITAGTFRNGDPLTSSDPVELKVNSRLCPVAPAPTATETEVPKLALQLPTPEPPHPAEGPGLTINTENRFHLGCLAASPEPFNFAGTFIGFCLKREADMTLNLYSADTGKLVRQMKSGSFRAGDDDQLFFNAMDDSGHLLGPGAYVLELIAEKDGYKERRNITIHFKKDRG